MTTPTTRIPPPALVVDVSILLPSADFATDLHLVKTALDNVNDALGDQVAGARVSVQEIRWSRPPELKL